MAHVWQARRLRAMKSIVLSVIMRLTSQLKRVYAKKHGNGNIFKSHWYHWKERKTTHQKQSFDKMSWDPRIEHVSLCSKRIVDLIQSVKSHSWGVIATFLPSNHFSLSSFIALWLDFSLLAPIFKWKPTVEFNSKQFLDNCTQRQHSVRVLPANKDRSLRKERESTIQDRYTWNATVSCWFSAI